MYIRRDLGFALSLTLIGWLERGIKGVGVLDAWSGQQLKTNKFAEVELFGKAIVFIIQILWTLLGLFFVSL